MYERFTDRARKAMQLANREAQRFGHEYVSTEHILLGILSEGTGVAVNVLKNLNVSLENLRLMIGKRVQPSPDGVVLGKLPLTGLARKVIEEAIHESQKLQQRNYIGTEHLLAGLLRVPQGVACEVLIACGVTLKAFRKNTSTLLGEKQVATDLEPFNRMADDFVTTQAVNRPRIIPPAGYVITCNDSTIDFFTKAINSKITMEPIYVTPPEAEYHALASEPQEARLTIDILKRDDVVQLIDDLIQRYKTAGRTDAACAMVELKQALKGM